MPVLVSVSDDIGPLRNTRSVDARQKSFGDPIWRVRNATRVYSVTVESAYKTFNLLTTEPLLTTKSPPGRAIFPRVLVLFIAFTAHSAL